VNAAVPQPRGAEKRPCNIALALAGRREASRPFPERLGLMPRSKSMDVEDARHREREIAARQLPGSSVVG
jgi:hypothetical protein